MADNYVANAGAGGNTFASDDVSSVHYPRVKLALGPDGVVANNGTTPNKYLSAGAANQDSTVVKGSIGALYGLVAVNLHTAMRYLKIYDKSSGPTSADTPKHIFPLAPNGGGIARTWPFGLAFANGIGFRITTGVADADTGAAGSNEVVVNTDHV